MNLASLACSRSLKSKNLNLSSIWFHILTLKLKEKCFYFSQRKTTRVREI